MALDGSSVCHKSYPPKRDIPPIHSRTTRKKTPQIDWKSISPISLKIDQDPQRALHALYYSTNENPPLLPNRLHLLRHYGNRIWNHLFAIHNYAPSL